MSYTPTDWKTGDVIIAEKLNHLEEGVATATSSSTTIFPIVINYDETTKTFTLSRTWQEIHDAIDSGELIRCTFTDRLQSCTSIQTEYFTNHYSVVVNVSNYFMRFVSETADGYPTSQIYSNPSYFTFQSDDSFTVTDKGSEKDGIIEYSTDHEHWSVWDGSTLNSSNGKLYFRGVGNSTLYNLFSDSIEGDENLVVSLIGNIETLLDYQIIERGGHPRMQQDCYGNLFYGMLVRLDAFNMIIPEVGDSSCNCMFGDSALISSPQLPSVHLVRQCYYSMFSNCSFLITAPELPATVLADKCYSRMFQGCTSIVTPPRLLATTLADECYDQMFHGCTSLTSISALPATILKGNCYNQMFYNCSQIKLSTTQTGEYQNEYRIPTIGTGDDGGTSVAYDMFANTGGTFTDTPDINTMYYTSNQVI